MKFSELETSKLTESDIYDLVMSGVTDYSKQSPTPQTNPDFLVVLGCSPYPLKARVVKMMHLYNKGYGKNILFSGGKGWHKLFKKQKRSFSTSKEQDEYMKRLSKKRREMREALEETLPNYIKPKQTRYMQRRLKQTLALPEAELSELLMDSCKDIGHIDKDKIFFESESANTIQNLEYSKRLLDQLQASGKVDEIKRIMIITSSFHCRRAVLSFKKYFPDIDVLACPATRDFEDKGLTFTKESLMSNNYYNQQFKNELNAIVNYTRNGSISDMDIENVLSPEKAEEIIGKMKNEMVQE